MKGGIFDILSGSYADPPVSHSATAEIALDGFEQGDRSKVTIGPVKAYCEAGSKRLLALRNSFIERNVQLLVDAVSEDCKSGPVLMPQIH